MNQFAPTDRSALHALPNWSSYNSALPFLLLVFVFVAMRGGWFWEILGVGALGVCALGVCALGVGTLGTKVF